mmetsp:Transcript_46432/g.140609  ORF Transcript_46432/g.140609 Transcript_46432/m.140609 type:complete len:85 (-) Transcript_46432:868-1122(-)
MCVTNRRTLSAFEESNATRQSYKKPACTPTCTNMKGAHLSIHVHFRRRRLESIRYNDLKPRACGSVLVIAKWAKKGKSAMRKSK